MQHACIYPNFLPKQKRAAKGSLHTARLVSCDGSDVDPGIERLVLGPDTSYRTTTGRFERAAFCPFSVQREAQAYRRKERPSGSAQKKLSSSLSLLWRVGGTFFWFFCKII